MISAPRVSVIVATYNRAQTVVEAIESVLAQTFGDLEIIVCDDGSTDDTAERIAALRGPILHLRAEHCNLVGRVRNHGLRRARGELIAVLDDDDAWEPEKLARQVAVLDADPEVGLVYTGYSILDDDGIHVPQLEPWQRGRGPLLGRLLRGCFIHPSTVLVRRTLLDRVGGWDERRFPCEDYELLLRLAPLTLGMCLAEPLARLRFGGANASVRNRPLIYDVSAEILEEWLASGTLTARERLRCRAAIADFRVGAARVARDAGDGRRARRHAVAALARNPGARRAWTALARCVLPAR